VRNDLPPFRRYRSSPLHLAKSPVVDVCPGFLWQNIIDLVNSPLLTELTGDTPLNRCPPARSLHKSIPPRVSLPSIGAVPLPSLSGGQTRFPRSEELRLGCKVKQQPRSPTGPVKVITPLTRHEAPRWSVRTLQILLLHTIVFPPPPRLAGKPYIT